MEYIFRVLKEGLGKYEKTCKPVLAKSSAVLMLMAISGLLTSCAFGKKEVIYFSDIPQLCRKELAGCFGEEYTISPGVERETRFVDEYESREIITHYTEWELAYKDAEGQEQVFVLNSRNGRMEAEEHLEKSMESYFSRLVETYYKQNFWDEAVSGIEGFKEGNSVLYFKSYRLFSMPDVPKTSVMFDERIQYSLTEHIYFPGLAYDEVFHEFPYLLNMNLYVTYESADEEERKRQCRETEEKVRKMTDEMIRYTKRTLNATVYVTMMDENGYADGFSFGILNGEYFPDEPGLEYEIALHENFFGKIETE